MWASMKFLPAFRSFIFPFFAILFGERRRKAVNIFVSIFNPREFDFLYSISWTRSFLRH